MSEPIICVGMPARDQWVCHAAAVAMQHCVSGNGRVIDMFLPPCPLLDFNFNQYWAEALNQRDESGATHFAMIHNDVCPEAGWASILLDELTRLDADVVSAVVPLKDWSGDSSTAVYDGENPWERRKLSMAECHGLPEAFSAEDAGEPLMLNTGLWICDLRKPWCDDWHFQSQTRIVWKNGRRVAEVMPEDWAFSHWLNQRGARLFATRKIKLLHVGQIGFPNAEPQAVGAA
jgi:hypothetical protein